LPKQSPKRSIADRRASCQMAVPEGVNPLLQNGIVNYK